MQTLVVYESMFGNTEEVARAVARGLELAGSSVSLVEVNQAPEQLPGDVDLLVVGGPTHAFSLSRASTRADAVRQGAPQDRAGVGVREWLGALRFAEPRPAVATFDTRVSKVRWLPKAGGPKAARLARDHGLELLVRPMSFTVEDVKGPLTGGELERAVAWGRELAATYGDRRAARGAAAGPAEG